MAIASATFEEQYLSILERASKPGRYIGGEPNMIRKDLGTIEVRFALAFPDVYEIGMSHNGLRMLHHLLNGIEDVYAERVFAPWVDMADLMQAEGLPLLSGGLLVPPHSGVGSHRRHATDFRDAEKHREP